MQVPSLRSGCEIAQFLFATWLVSWTDTSTCYQHLVISTDTSSSCELDRHIDMLASSCKFMLPQTKILEGLTIDEMRIFDAFFNGSYPKSSTHALENVLRKSGFLLLSILPKSSFGRDKVLQTHRHAIITWVRTTHRHASIILCVRQTHRHAIIILWVRQTHRHAIIILWVRQTHRHAIIILWVRQTHRHAIIILWVRKTHHHLVSWTDTSTCYQHLVISTDTS